MKIALGSDHGGFDLKSAIKEHLQTLGHEVIDFGTDSHESCDYPLIAEPAARAVASGECDRGILVCGTGIGIGIAANKVPGIRAALCHDTFSALTMGQRVIGEGLALDIVDVWLESEFDGGRHERRVNEISDIEKKAAK